SMPDFNPVFTSNMEVDSYEFLKNTKSIVWSYSKDDVSHVQVYNLENGTITDIKTPYEHVLFFYETEKKDEIIIQGTIGKFEKSKRYFAKINFKSGLVWQEKITGIIEMVGEN